MDFRGGWLAVVTRAPFQHKGKTQTTAAGVKLIEKGWYLAVQYYERTPPSSVDTFQLSALEMVIDAEGVIFASPSLLEPARPQRVLRAARGERSVQALMKLVAAADVIANIEASLKSLSL
jgi:hypothetical protein